MQAEGNRLQDSKVHSSVFLQGRVLTLEGKCQL